MRGAEIRFCLASGGGSSVPNFSVETGFEAALRIIPCWDLLGEIEGFEHSFSEAIWYVVGGSGAH